MRALLPAVSTCLLLLGCSSINEGMTDVRRLNPGAWTVAAPPANTTPIGVNETVLVTLQQMYIRDFDELRLEPGRILIGGDAFNPRGEIAVLVGVPNESGPAAFASSNGHLVVFYSNDVVRNQFLNFRNQRVFGPTVVTNDRLEMEFLVMELDRTSDEETELLANLAELGKTYAGVPGPALDVLVNLGSSLLTAQSDDIELRYRMTFDLGNRPNARFPLYPGYYALIRERRSGVDDPGPGQDATVWDSLCLNQDDGRLYQRSGNPATCTFTPGNLYDDETYLTIHVERGVPASNQAMTSFAALGTQLAETPNASARAVNDTIEAFRTRISLDGRERTIWDALSAMEAAAAQYGSLRRQCPSGDGAAAEGALLRRSVELHRRLAAEAGEVVTPATDDSYDAEIYEQQVERLVDYFVRLHWAQAGQEAALLAQSKDPTQFATVFGTPAEFAARLKDRADEVWPTVQCPSPPIPPAAG